MINRILLLLIFVSYNSIAQSSETAESLFAKSQSYNTVIDSINNNYDSIKADEAEQIIKEQLLTSLRLTDELLNKFPDSPLAHDALYNKAWITYKYLNLQDAKEAFLKIINSKSESLIHMRSSLRYLAAICIMEKNYEQGIKYLDQSIEYKKLFTCGNDYEIDSARLRNMYTECFNGLSKGK